MAHEHTTLTFRTTKDGPNETVTVNAPNDALAQEFATDLQSRIPTRFFDGVIPAILNGTRLGAALPLGPLQHYDLRESLFNAVGKSGTLITDSKQSGSGVISVSQNKEMPLNMQVHFYELYPNKGTKQTLSFRITPEPLAKSGYVPFLTDNKVVETGGSYEASFDPLFSPKSVDLEDPYGIVSSAKLETPSFIRDYSRQNGFSYMQSANGESTLMQELSLGNGVDRIIRTTRLSPELYGQEIVSETGHYSGEDQREPGRLYAIDLYTADGHQYQATVQRHGQQTEWTIKDWQDQSGAAPPKLSENAMPIVATKDGRDLPH